MRNGGGRSFKVEARRSECKRQNGLLPLRRSRGRKEAEVQVATAASLFAEGFRERGMRLAKILFVCAAASAAAAATGSVSGAAPAAAAAAAASTTAAAAAAASAAAAAAPPPRLIISCMVDDLGFGDLGFAGSGIATPHLDRLRAEGVELSSFYAQPICTPTRGSFLTGRYALSLGLQGRATVQQGQAWGLDVDEQTFVSAFQGAGWATHMVGKVHLGADRWRRTPTFRGFDTFVGYLYGAEDYYTHVLGQGFDLRNDSSADCGPGCSRNIAQEHNGTYSSQLFGAEVARLVAGAPASGKPTYIHFTPQSVHAPNEAPAAAVAPYLPIFGPNNTVRAIHAGAVTCLDDSIGVIFAAVEAAGLANDTLFILHADNGGPLGATGDGTMASNYPLRGGKHSIFEGGTHVGEPLFAVSEVGSDGAGGIEQRRPVAGEYDRRRTLLREISQRLQRAEVVAQSPFGVLDHRRAATEHRVARQQCPEMIEAVTVMGPDRGSRGDRRHRRVGRIIEGVEQGGSLRKNGTQGFDQGFSSRFLLHQGSSFPITGMDRRWIRRRVAEQRATVRANPKSRP